MKVAVSGVVALLGAIAALAGVAIRVGANEPGVDAAWRTAGVAIAIAGAVTFVAAAAVTATLVVSWRRHRLERSNRP